MDCIVHGVAKSRTRLSDFHFTYHYRAPGPMWPSDSGDIAWSNMRPCPRGAQGTGTAAQRSGGPTFRSHWQVCFSLKFLLIYVCVYFWLCWALVAARAFL